MDNAVDGRVLLEDGIERRLIRYVGLIEEGPLAAEELDAVEGYDGRVVEAVDDDDIIAVLEEGEGREGADIAGSSAVCVSWYRCAIGGCVRTRLLGLCRRAWLQLGCGSYVGR